MDDPVVVKPEIVSKNAFVKDGIQPLIKKGRAPKKEITSQLNVTIKYPSRLAIFFRSFLFENPLKTSAVTIIIKTEISKGKSGSSNHHATTSPLAIKIASKMSKKLSIQKMSGMLINLESGIISN
jgi:hypothetical protein